MIQITHPTTQKINFRPLTCADKASYEARLADGSVRGCEFSFANLFLWGDQRAACLHGCFVLLSRFGSRYVYPYPIGRGDRRAVLDAIIADARARGIPCRLSGLDDEAKRVVEELYPGSFRFHQDEGSFDYVYAIDDLADLKGKKYHGKRNHLHRFYEAVPDAATEPLSEENLPQVRAMTEEWYRTRLAEDPHGDYTAEQAALDRAFRHFHELGMEGLVLTGGGEVLGVTLASRLTEDTMDVHFEKARGDIPGAYAAINRELARFIRTKYPSVRYLDREEDMGLEGLRRAKRSYHPHHMIEKWRAYLKEDDREV